MRLWRTSTPVALAPLAKQKGFARGTLLDRSASSTPTTERARVTHHKRNTKVRAPAVAHPAANGLLSF